MGKSESRLKYVSISSVKTALTALNYQVNFNSRILFGLTLRNDALAFLISVHIQLSPSAFVLPTKRVA